MTINNDALMFGEDDIPSLRIVDGLHDYLASPIAQPAVPDLRTLEGLTGEQLKQLNISRLRFLSGGLVVSTPQMTKITGQVERLIVENQGRNSGLVGLIIYGESTMGKTTTAKAVMRRVFYKYSLAYPGMKREQRIPVVYVEVPPGASGKALARRFAGFLQLPISPQETAEGTMQRVVNLLDRAKTRLVVVDELHNLKLRTSGSGEGVDFLKGLSNQLHATFVYVGIALNDSALFAGDRGRQITGRFISAPLRPFTFATQEDKVLWREVIEAFESNLCLASHKPGDLGALSEYLYERTGGLHRFTRAPSDRHGRLADLQRRTSRGRGTPHEETARRNNFGHRRGVIHAAAGRLERKFITTRSGSEGLRMSQGLPDSPFPLRVRPFHLETQESYWRRLADENFEPSRRLNTYARSLRKARSGLTYHEAARLIIEALGELQKDHFTSAITVLAPHSSGQYCPYCVLGVVAPLLCRRCAQGKQVTQYPNLRMVCLKHRLWTGFTTAPADQVAVGRSVLQAENSSAD